MDQGLNEDYFWCQADLWILKSWEYTFHSLLFRYIHLKLKLVHENLTVLIVSVIKTSVFQKPIPGRCPLYTDHHHPHLSPCGHVGLERSSPPTLLDFVASSLKINLNPCKVAKLVKLQNVRGILRNLCSITLKRIYVLMSLRNGGKVMEQDSYWNFRN